MRLGRDGGHTDTIPMLLGVATGGYSERDLRGNFWMSFVCPYAAGTVANQSCARNSRGAGSEPMGVTYNYAFTKYPVKEGQGWEKVTLLDVWDCSRRESTVSLGGVS